MSKPEMDVFYQRKAKDLTDMLFDKRFLNDDLTRDSIVWLEDYLAFILQSESEMSAKCAVLSASLRDIK